MDASDQALLSKFRGAVLGSAVADALAFPYQHYSRGFLRSIAHPLAMEMADHHAGFHPRGQWSDETQCLLATIRAIAEDGAVHAASIASRLVSLRHDQLLVEPEPSLGRALDILASGDVSVSDAGLEPGHAEAAPAARAIAIGLWQHERPEELARDTDTSTRITHRDPRSLATAAAIAAGIAVNVSADELMLGEFLDAVAGAAGRHDPLLAEAVLDFPRVLSLSEDRALRHFDSLSPDDRYPPSPDGMGTYCIPVLLAALYYFLKAPYRYEVVVERCLRVGGRIDTLAFLAGSLSGALGGESAIPGHLVTGLFHAEEISVLADDLFARAAARNGP
jgi:ADP-ribosylglycohydrolase